MAVLLANSGSSRVRPRWIACAAGLALCSATPVAAGGPPAPSPERLERITAFFDEEVASGRLPGAVVLVQQHGRPVYLKCFGVRDIGSGRPMTPDTIFAIHSMTKPITSLAAMMLIDAGKLSAGDQLSSYIPAFASVKVGVEGVDAQGRPALKLIDPVRPVTIMDLMRHTSGISYDYIGGELIEQAYREAHIFAGSFDNREFAERIAKLPLARQPGTLWRYGHSTDVLGRVIELVSGRTLYRFMKEHILDPLGMSSTKFVLENDAGAHG